jgi:predicted nucleic-acid-binding Zn-ribbon protein
MDTPCSKCGSTEVLTDIPVVTSVDRFSANPVVALAHKKPDALVFKQPVTRRFLARICGSCGFAEFYVEDPKGFVAIAKRAAGDT